MAACKLVAPCPCGKPVLEKNMGTVVGGMRLAYAPDQLMDAICSTLARWESLQAGDGARKGSPLPWEAKALIWA